MKTNKDTVAGSPSEKDSTDNKHSKRSARKKDIIEKKDSDTIENEEDELSLLLSKDLSNASKEELLKLSKLEKNYDIVSAYKKFQHLESFFSAIHNKEKAAAYQKYLKDGGEEDGFEFKSTNNDSFFTTLKEVRKKYKAFKSQQQRQRKSNTVVGEQIIEKIREILKHNESRNSIDKIKELQNQWSSLNGFPPAQAHELYKTYNALLDIYYDNRSIYRDLKELDRQKNLKKKLAICAKLEVLAEDKSNTHIFRTMRQLKDDYWKIGPVPRDVAEEIKNRFNQALQILLIFKSELEAVRDQDRKENQKRKELLLEQIKQYANYKSTNHKEWMSKSKEVKALQSEWESIGAMPKNTKAEEISKEFWKVLKSFFNSKRGFIKDVEKERQENLGKKKKLIEQATSLKESTEWEKTADKLKEIQKKWKTIGPVPYKVSDEVFNTFKNACNYFFEKLKEHRSSQNNQQKDNLNSRYKIIEKLNALDKEKHTLEDLKKLTDAFKNAGDINVKQQYTVDKNYEKAVEVATRKLQLEDDLADEILLENDIELIKNNAEPEKAKMEVKRKFKRKMSGLEQEISLIENNLALFSKPSNRNSSKDKKKSPLDNRLDAFSKQLDENKEKIKRLQQQMKMIDKIKIE